MKSKRLFNNIMHFLVHNSFLFTVVIMCLVHATMLGICLISGVMPLMFVNVLSVVVYLFCIVLCNFGHILPVYISVYLEVSVYCIIAVHYIGWVSASYFFLFAIVPIIIYFGCFIFKGRKRLYIVLLLVLNFALYFCLYLRYADAKPLYELSYGIRTTLVIFTTFVMVFSVIFYNTIYIYSSEFEMSSLELKNEQLSADACRDVLTKLLNRRGFLPLVSELMDDKKSNHFCIAFCDIDNFKRINDSYGHDCGDEVLRHISKTIQKEMPGCDICRWGGEEIVILMRDYEFSEAKQKMENLRKCIETNPTVFYNKRISATITIGLEERKTVYNGPEEIIKTADERMYYGKQHGKNILIFKDA